MEVDNKKPSVEHVNVVTTLFVAFGQSGDGKRIALYTKMLCGIPADILKIVCEKAMLQRQFLPSIAELVTDARSLMGDSTHKGVKPFAEVWEEVLQQMQEVFVYDTPTFSTPEIEKAVKAFGWQELCAMETKNKPIVRAQFRDMYAGVCEQELERRVNRYVTGKGDLIPCLTQQEAPVLVNGGGSE